MIDVSAESEDQIQRIFDDPRVFVIYLVIGGQGTDAGDTADGIEADKVGVSVIRFLPDADSSAWMKDPDAAAVVVGKPRTKRRSLTAEAAKDIIAVYEAIDEMMGN